MDTPLLVFCHVPKTAGTALRVAMGDHFQMYNAYPRTQANLTHPIQQLPDNTEVVFGHFWAGLYKGDHVLIMRNPAERAVSNYYHFLKAAEGVGNNLLMQAIRREEVSLGDWIAGNGPGDTIWPDYPQERPWNMMARWIAGIPDPHRWAYPDLWSKTMYGAQKRFAAVATNPQKLFDFLGKKHGFEGTVPQYNLNPNNPGTEALSPAQHQQLIERNLVDFRLFDMVNQAGGILCSPF